LVGGVGTGVDGVFGWGLGFFVGGDEIVYGYMDNIAIYVVYIISIVCGYFLWFYLLEL
jgi:hypothetical protein